MTVINIIIIILKVVFLLGFLVLIHEGGHFLIAKLCKVTVNEFAIGFGPTIFKSKNTKTKYALRLIPLGGFVSMEGEEQRSDKEGSFSKASIPKRIAIVIAGGMVNIIFALVVYWVLISSKTTFITTKIENVVTDSGAYYSGIIKEDEIIKVNGKRVRNKVDLDKQMEKTKGEKTILQIKRNGENIEVEVTPTIQKVKDTGIRLENVSSKIIVVYPDSQAEKSGIKVDDEIVKIDGKEVANDAYKVVEYIDNSENENMIFTIKRNEEILELEVTPKIINKYLLGVELQDAPKNLINDMYYGFLDTVDFSVSIIDNLKMLFTGKVSSDQLMGPIGISTVVADTKGITDYIYILALISLSLGVTNLLPFPPLDGGKVVIYIIEAIRRKPMKEEVEVGIQTVGFMLLIGLSIFVAYKDILRFF